MSFIFGCVGRGDLGLNSLQRQAARCMRFGSNQQSHRHIAMLKTKALIELNGFCVKAKDIEGNKIYVVFSGICQHLLHELITDTASPPCRTNSHLIQVEAYMRLQEQILGYLVYLIKRTTNRLSFDIGNIDGARLHIGFNIRPELAQVIRYCCEQSRRCLMVQLLDLCCHFGKSRHIISCSCANIKIHH